MTTFRNEELDLIQDLAVADLLDGGGDVLAELVRGRDVAMVYSDPPWNPGNEKWWRRHAGAEPPDSYDHLLDAWCACVAACRPAHVFSEQSVNEKHRKMFTDAVDRCDGWTLPLLEEWTVYYGSGGSRSCIRPNKLLHFGTQQLATDPTDLRGIKMTECVFDGLGLPARSLVVDPCMGKGMTSRVSHSHGLCCVGTELNPKRLAKTQEWLLKHGYVRHE